MADFDAAAGLGGVLDIRAGSERVGFTLGPDYGTSRTGYWCQFHVENLHESLSGSANL